MKEKVGKWHRWKQHRSIVSISARNKNGGLSIEEKLVQEWGEKTEAWALKNESLKQNENNLIGATIAKYIDPLHQCNTIFFRLKCRFGVIAPVYV